MTSLMVGVPLIIIHAVLRGLCLGSTHLLQKILFNYICLQRICSLKCVYQFQHASEKN